MKVLALKSNQLVLLDDEDLERAAAFAWCLSGNGHVMRYETWRGRPYAVYLHHFIVGRPLNRNKLIDHINQNPLDNRKENLRIADKRINALNTGLRRDNTSGFKGVYRKRDRWRAAAFLNGKYISLGSFATKGEAEYARQEYRRTHEAI